MRALAIGSSLWCAATATSALASCGMPGPSAPVPTRYYGAIAYDHDTGAWGTSYDYADQSGAHARALGECSRGGKSCAVVVEIMNACGAYAGGVIGRFATGRGATPETAEASALEECGKGDDECRVLASTCTTR